MNKGIIGILTAFIIALGLIAISQSGRENTFDTGSSDINTNRVEDRKLIEQQKINLSHDEMIEIAEDLFDDYINENRTDWYTVKVQKLDRDPVICLKDYKINSIDFVGQDKNKFTVNISYDIQYTDESNYWVAGNGELSDDNWVIDKCNFVDITKVDNNYFITNVYTG